MKAKAYVLALIVITTIFSSIASGSPEFILEKSVCRSILVTFNGESVESRVYVTLSVEGYGVVNLTDRIMYIKENSLEFYGLQPSEVRVNGSVVELYWRNVRVDGRLKIRYSAESLIVPVIVWSEINVDNTSTSPANIGSFYLVNRSSGCEISYVLHLKNNLSLGNVTPPLFAFISWTIDSSRFTMLDVHPKPNIITMVGEYFLLSWFTVLDDNYTISLRLKVSGMSEWKEATLTAPRVEVFIDPSLYNGSTPSMSELEDMIKGFKLLDSLMGNITIALDNMTTILNILSENFTEYADMLEECANISSRAASGLMNASMEAEKLADDVEELTARLSNARDTLSTALGYVDKAITLLEKIYGILDSLPLSDNYLGNVKKNLKEAIDDLSEVRSLLNTLDNLLDSNVSSNIREFSSTLKTSSGYLMELAEGLRNASMYTRAMAEQTKGYAEEIVERRKLLDENIAEFYSYRETIELNLKLIEERKTAIEALNIMYETEQPVLEFSGNTIEAKFFTSEVSVKTYNLVVRDPAKVSLPSNQPKDDVGYSYVSRLNLVIAALIAVVMAIGFTGVYVRNNRKIKCKDLLDEIDTVITEIDKLNGDE